MNSILVIEDNEEVRENLEEILELYGYKVYTAEDGQKGVHEALEHLPDLILCDVMMPKLDGFGVLNILSKKPATAHIPFVFLTAKAEKSDWRRGMNLGADDYITKPFYKDELLQVIETRLKKSIQLKNQLQSNPSNWNAFMDEAKGYEALEKLSNEHALKKLKKKEHLFLEDDLPRYLYFVIKGKIKIYKTSDYGKEYIIHICEAGQFIGYTPLIKDEKYSFGASVLEEAELRLIPKKDFLDLLYANRDVAAQFIKMLANNVIEKEEQLLQLAYSSVRKRVANALLSLENQSDSNQSIQILRDDLARMVGTAKESVIRVLSEFKQDGYIEINNGKISIINVQKLKRLPA